MTVLCKIESLAPELLEHITDHLIAVPDMKRWRQVSRHLALFDAGLFETVNVCMMEDSLSKFDSIARHPTFRNKVQKVIFWLPRFERTQDTTHGPVDPLSVGSLYDEIVLLEESVNTRNNFSYTNSRINTTLQDHLNKGSIIPTFASAFTKLSNIQTVSISYCGPQYTNNLCISEPRVLKYDRSDFLCRILQVISASKIDLRGFEMDPDGCIEHNIRVLEMPESDLEVLAKVFKPLQNLTLGLLEPSLRITPSPTRFARILRLAPRLQKLSVVLAAKDEHPHNLFADITWPALRSLKLKSCTNTPCNELIAFLDRHISTLEEVELSYCLLADNATWKHIFHRLRDYPDRNGKRKIVLHALRLYWGGPPFRNSEHETQHINDFMNGQRDWTVKLENAYELHQYLSNS